MALRRPLFAKRPGRRSSSLASLRHSADRDQVCWLLFARMLVQKSSSLLPLLRKQQPSDTRSIVAAGGHPKAGSAKATGREKACPRHSHSIVLAEQLMAVWCDYAAVLPAAACQLVAPYLFGLGMRVAVERRKMNMSGILQLGL